MLYELSVANSSWDVYLRLEAMQLRQGIFVVKMIFQPSTKNLFRHLHRHTAWRNISYGNPERSTINLLGWINSLQAWIT